MPCEGILRQYPKRGSGHVSVPRFAYEGSCMNMRFLSSNLHTYMVSTPRECLRLVSPRFRRRTRGFLAFCQCLDSQTFVLFCRPDEASPYYERAFSGQPKSLFRAVIRCFLWCGGGVSGMRESLYGSARECFQCCDCIIIRILYTSDSLSVPVLRICFVMIFTVRRCIFMQWHKVWNAAIWRYFYLRKHGSVVRWGCNQG